MRARDIKGECLLIRAMEEDTDSEYVYFYARRKAEHRDWRVTSRELDYFLRVEGPGGHQPIDHLDVREETTPRPRD